MTNQQQLISNVITKRAKEIIELVSMDMDVEWAINYVKNSTSLSAHSMEKVIELVNQELQKGI